MHTFPYLRVPIHHPQSFTLNGIPAFGSRIAELAFKRRVVHHEEQVFLIYECIQPGCRGCGCPSFPAVTVLPEAIWEHLSLHAGLCEGLVRSDVPK